MNSTVTAVESFRFLGTTISKYLKRDNHIESIVKKAQQRLYFLRPLKKFNLPKELLITVLLCHHWICSLHVNNCLVQLGNQICPQKTTEGKLLSESSVQPSPLSNDCTYPEWAKGLVISLRTPHILHTPSLNCYRLVDATELWAPEQPDTETVSSPKQSISWTLDIKHGTHSTIIQLFIHHTHIFFFHFKFARQTSHINVCIVYCVFAIL